MKKLLFILLLFPNFTLASSNSQRCLAQVMHNEAQGTTKQEKLLVAETVLTRTKHKDFPSSICSVVNQRKQFANQTTKIPKKTQELAAAVLERRVKMPGIKPLYFHTRNSKPYWAKKKKLVLKTKYHNYYR